MKQICILLVTLLATGNIYAAEMQATDASVRELLTLTRTQKMLDSIFNQVDTSLERSIRQGMAGRNMNLEQEAIMENMRKQLIEIYKSALSWKDYEPILINIYRKTFTESEVQGMISFYKTPAGQAVVKKMPMVMQSSMRAAQGRMREIMPKLQALERETIQHLRDAAKDKK